LGKWARGLGVRRQELGDRRQEKGERRKEKEEVSDNYHLRN
jgi:hypothetical protein